MVIEKHPEEYHFDFSVVLNVPGKVLTTHERGEDLQQVVKKVIRSMERQVKKHLDLIRQQHLWRRPKRSARMKRKRTEALQTDSGGRSGCMHASRFC